MDAKRIREIPNERLAIYLKEIPAQLAELQNVIARVTGSGVPGMSYKTLRDEIAIAVLIDYMAKDVLSLDRVAIQKKKTAMECYKWADSVLEAREAE